MMRGRMGIRRRAWRTLLVAGWAGGLLALAVRGQAQSAPKPITYRGLVAYLNGRVPEARIRTLVGRSGCAAPLTDKERTGLEALGASAGLLAFLASTPTCGASAALARVDTATPATSSSAAAIFGAEQWVSVFPGTFQMGSTAGETDERPVRTVTISTPFLLQKTEVTQAQWQAVMGGNPSFHTACGPTCPVERVSWDDIQVFLTRLNTQDPGKQYRLPTEAEWEYAARAGTTGAYGGSGVLDQMGWYADNAGGQTHPVAQKSPNAWGLYDMHGNVMEWVADRWARDAYAGAVTADPTGPETGEERVLRGGAWSFIAYHARSSYRLGDEPVTRDNLTGFRLARAP